MRRTLTPAWLDKDIRNAITVYPDPRGDPLAPHVQASMGHAGLPLAIKYVPVQWAKTYLQGSALKVSTTVGFTWGTGTYVAPTAFPISTAIYGRVGVVAAFDPAGWKVFDATNPQILYLYLTWVGFQPLYRVLASTMHSALANQFLRDLFRTTYSIDCVLFHPDQRNAIYTERTDVWMNVTDWVKAGEIDSTFSRRLSSPRATVLAEEEFAPLGHDIGRRTLIGPRTPRQPNALVQQLIAGAYAAGDVVRLEA